MSIPRSLESLGVAAAVLNGMIVQRVVASTAEDRRRVARQVDNQINVLLEELDAYRVGVARKPRTAQSGEGVTVP